MNPLTGAVVLCGIVCTAVVAMSPESVELQTRLLRGIYDEAVKDSHLQGDDSEELNLLKNESAGFATSVLSFSEKGESIEYWLILHNLSCIRRGIAKSLKYFQ